MISFSRRQLFGAAAAASTQFILPVAAQNESAPTPIAAFSFEEVIRRAQALSAAPFDASTPKPPAPFDALDYDAWRDIRFKRDQAFLAGTNGGFRLETFHLGFLYGRAITINTIRDG
ncbi:MAG: glucan biosynthesis protein, partial [Methylocystis sp.]